MKKKEWNEGLDHLDPDLVEKYVAQKDSLRQKKKTKGALLGFAALAAGFIVIVSAIGNSGGQLPNVPTWNNAHYSAEEISKMFGGYKSDTVSTNAYTKVYVPDAKYLYISAIAEQDYLGVYRYIEKENKLGRKEFQTFIDGFLPKLAASINAPLPQYEIKEYHDFEDDLEVYDAIGNHTMIIRQNENSSFFGIYNRSNDDKKFVLDGETIQIDQRWSDEEIITSIQSVKNKLFDIFNVSFTDTKVIRYYGSFTKHGAERIYIYFYDKTAHPLNSTQDSPISDYISIEFDNFLDHEGDIVSDNILTKINITFSKVRNNIVEEYAPVANAKRISLEDAEALLYNGYVFGGHSCPLCMAAQDKISFDGYDFVDIEYVFGHDPQTLKRTTGLPFYAFYKKIGTSVNGNEVYAKTYVAAIEVSGYDAYFESQIENHRNMQ